MSARSRDLPRRSVLAVPGSSDRFLHKAPEIDADMFVLDLEDAVVPEEKAAARKRVVAAIQQLDFSDRIVAVRVNDWSSPHTLWDLIEVVGGAGERLDVIMVPKCESAGEVVAFDLVLSQIERQAGLAVGHVGLEVQIESAQGLDRLREISMASARLEGIVLGPADLAASLGMPMLVGGDVAPDYPGDHFHAASFALVVAARSVGIQVVDGPYLRLDDRDGLEQLARRARAIGFDGKWAIHPDQVEVLNSVFSPEPEQIARAEAILHALEHGESTERRGALRNRGEMLDEASRKMALSTIARAKRLERTSSGGTDRTGAAEGD